MNICYLVTFSDTSSICSLRFNLQMHFWNFELCKRKKEEHKSMFIIFRVEYLLLIHDKKGQFGTEPNTTFSVHLTYFTGHEIKFLCMILMNQFLFVLNKIQGMIFTSMTSPGE